MRWFSLLFCCLIVPSLATAQVVDGLREQTKIRETLLTAQVDEMIDAHEALREAWGRLEQQAVGLLRAQREGEAVDNLRLRDADLRQVEAEFYSALLQAQQLRRAAIENRTMLAAIEVEIQRLSVEVGGAEAPLTGTWSLLVEPGQDGMAYLQQQGTLVTGTYSLSGGFSGSFRGTLVAGKVRLERIDSQIGFAAIFYGRLVGSGDNARLQGNWEATQLTSGLPSAGNWTASRVGGEQ
jgi:hypothetical protein